MHAQLSSHFFHFSMTYVFMVSNLFTTIPFLFLPFLCMDRWCLQIMDFFDLWCLPNYLSCTYWLIISFCMRTWVNIIQKPWFICRFWKILETQIVIYLWACYKNAKTLIDHLWVIQTFYNSTWCFFPIMEHGILIIHSFSK